MLKLPDKDFTEHIKLLQQSITSYISTNEKKENLSKVIWSYANIELKNIIAQIFLLDTVNSIMEITEDIIGEF